MDPYFPINLFRFCWYFMTHTSIRHPINGCTLKDKKDDGKKKMMHNETFYSDWLKQALWLWSPSNKTGSFSPTVRMSPPNSCQGMDCKHWAILGVLGFILLVLSVALFVLRNRFHRSTGNISPLSLPSQVCVCLIIILILDNSNPYLHITDDMLRTVKAFKIGWWQSCSEMNRDEKNLIHPLKHCFDEYCC